MKNLNLHLRSLLLPVRLNLLFVIVILNLWDLALNGKISDAAVLGILMFGPVMFLWHFKTIKTVAILILISLCEFVVMLIFIFQGLVLVGFESALRALFWLPYLIAAGANCFWGLKIYTKLKAAK